MYIMQMSAKFVCCWGCHVQNWSVIHWFRHIWLCHCGFYIF